VGEWINKPWSIHNIRHHSTIKTHEHNNVDQPQSYHAKSKIKQNPNQCRKVACSIAPFLWHSGKDKAEGIRRG
jgi:hypothetical protein